MNRRVRKNTRDEQTRGSQKEHGNWKAFATSYTRSGAGTSSHISGTHGDEVPGSLREGITQADRVQPRTKNTTTRFKRVECTRVTTISRKIYEKNTDLRACCWIWPNHILAAEYDGPRNRMWTMGNPMAWWCNCQQKVSLLQRLP